MTRLGGDSSICCDGQVVKQALFKVRKNDDEESIVDSEYGIILNIQIPECKGEVNHQHVSNHPPPGFPYAEELAFKCGYNLRIFELQRLRGEANVENVVKAVYEKWPLEPRISMVKLHEVNDEGSPN